MSSKRKLIMHHHISDSETLDSTDSESSDASTNTFELRKSSQLMEQVRVSKESLLLPTGLCENQDIFRKFFSLETYECLPDQIKDHLNSFLPSFNGVLGNSKEQQHQRDLTIKNLFLNQITRFGSSPLVEFQRNLEDGNYRPEVYKIRANIRKIKRREHRFQECERLSRFAKSLAVSRERLLRRKFSDHGKRARDKRIEIQNVGLTRARKRYIEEVSEINAYIGLETHLSDDEHSSTTLAKKSKRNSNNQIGLFGAGSEPKIVSTLSQNGNAPFPSHLSKIGSKESYQNMMTLHKTRKIADKMHAELNTSDIKLQDIFARVYNTPGRKPQNTSAKSFGLNDSSMKHLNTKDVDTAENMRTNIPGNNDIIEKIDAQSSPNVPEEIQNSFLLADEIVKAEIPDIDHKDFQTIDKLKVDQPRNLIDESDILLPMHEANNHNYSFKETNSYYSKPTIDSPRKYKQAEMFSEQKDSPEIGNITLLDPDVIKEEICNQNYQQNSTIQDGSLKKEKETIDCLHAGIIKRIDAGMDIARLPVDLDDSGNMDVLDNIDFDIKTEMLQETQSCFLSLVRYIFCSTVDHRTSLDNLRSKISAWSTNPITALNDWYNSAENWVDLAESAIDFLAGKHAEQPEDFVPYVEYKPELNVYQWIGAGRDTDDHLKPLCLEWLRKRSEKTQTEIPFVESAQIKSNTLVEIEDNIRVFEEPPPARFPTDWIVRKATIGEISEFRKQERLRFEHPHLAFTYRMHGYESVVGPVKGIYAHIPALMKARGHNMLTADRPSFVTILTLVRDSAARLPNGEGTRTDICELLKYSQYILPTASETVLATIVSGALDRMHTENDPCVRFDPKRKIWIYLHRNRSEEEFEKIHQQYQGVSKHKKQSNRSRKSRGGMNTTITTSSVDPPIKINDKNLAEANVPTKIQTNKIITISAPSAIIPTSTTMPSSLLNQTITLQDKSLLQTESVSYGSKVESILIDPLIVGDSKLQGPSGVESSSNILHQAKILLPVSSPTDSVSKFVNPPRIVTTNTTATTITTSASTITSSTISTSRLQPACNRSVLIKSKQIPLQSTVRLCQQKDYPALIPSQPTMSYPTNIGKSNFNAKSIQPIISELSSEKSLTIPRTFPKIIKVTRDSRQIIQTKPASEIVSVVHSPSTVSHEKSVMKPRVITATALRTQSHPTLQIIQAKPTSTSGICNVRNISNNITMLSQPKMFTTTSIANAPAASTSGTSVLLSGTNLSSNLTPIHYEQKSAQRSQLLESIPRSTFADSQIQKPIVSNVHKMTPVIMAVSALPTANTCVVSNAGNVLTSPPSLQQKQSVTSGTIRFTNSKSNVATNFVRLAKPSPQYAVVIPKTSKPTNQNLTSVNEKKTDIEMTTKTVINKPELLRLGPQQANAHNQKSAQHTAHLQPITVRQLTQLKGSTPRMVNASNLNIIGGKPIILSQQRVQLVQTQPQHTSCVNNSKLISTNIQPNSLIKSYSPIQTTTGNISLINLNATTARTIPTRTIQVAPKVVLASPNVKTKGNSTQRVVLAVQGTNPTQRVLFQSGVPVNLKSLQGLKMIPYQCAPSTNTSAGPQPKK